MTIKVKVWDWPLRLFHWLLVLSFSAAVITGELGGSWADWHGRSGLLLLGLLVFRILWGFIGTTHARFANFWPTPAKILAYVQGRWTGQGHNPLGALAVFALLGVLAAQVGSGLFANDDIAFQGPLCELVDKSFSDKLTAWHSRLFYVLAVLVGLHVSAIVFHLTIKKRNLIAPMLTGHKKVPRSFATPSSRLRLVSLILALVVSAFTVWSVGNGLPVRLVASVEASPVLSLW
jgi:cytochrome b